MDVDKMKVEVLKRELGARGLDTSGLKAVLQKRLKQALNVDAEGKREGASKGPGGAEEVKEIEEGNENGVEHGAAEESTKKAKKRGESAEKAEEQPVEEKDDEPPVESEKRAEQAEGAEQEATAGGEEKSAEPDVAAVKEADQAKESAFEAARRRRAERFGEKYEPLAKNSSKHEQRMERFGSKEKAGEKPAPKPMEEHKPAEISPEEAEKRRLRAQKFGLGERSAKDALEDEGLLKGPLRKREWNADGGAKKRSKTYES